MRATHAVQGLARAVGAAKGPDAYPTKGARFLDALRAAWGETRRKVRWHLRQRRPRPQWGDSAIDYLLAAGQNLVLIAVLIAIGG